MGLILDREQLCAALGISDSAITAWEGKGLPTVRKGRGRGMRSLYDLDAVRAWCAHRGYGHSLKTLAARLSRAELAPGPGAAPSLESPSEDAERPAMTVRVPGNDQPPPDVDDHGYFEARANRAKTEARLAELDYFERLGKLVSTDQVQAEVYALWTEAKQQIRTLPHELDRKLAAETDYARRMAIWERGLNDFLARLSASFAEPEGESS
jgi:phage terminase Nu1 subunit (DNA packaging protein)